jgi:arylsulfatase A-like enzyme
MDVRRAFYAQCTHIDHQLRLVTGTLREDEILDDTIILFTSDHGDLPGDDGLHAKRYMYEWSARVPMVLVGARGDERVGHHAVDDRVVGLQDVMPTLLDLAGIRLVSSGRHENRSADRGGAGSAGDVAWRHRQSRIRPLGGP